MTGRLLHAQGGRPGSLATTKTAVQLRRSPLLRWIPANRSAENR